MSRRTQIGKVPEKVVGRKGGGGPGTEEAEAGAAAPSAQQLLTLDSENYMAAL